MACSAPVPLRPWQASEGSEEESGGSPRRLSDDSAFAAPAGHRTPKRAQQAQQQQQWQPAQRPPATGPAPIEAAVSPRGFAPLDLPLQPLPSLPSIASESPPPPSALAQDLLLPPPRQPASATAAAAAGAAGAAVGWQREVVERAGAAEAWGGAAGEELLAPMSPRLALPVSPRSPRPSVSFGRRGPGGGPVRAADADALGAAGAAGAAGGAAALGALPSSPRGVMHSLVRTSLLPSHADRQAVAHVSELLSGDYPGAEPALSSQTSPLGLGSPRAAGGGGSSATTPRRQSPFAPRSFSPAAVKGPSYGGGVGVSSPCAVSRLPGSPFAATRAGSGTLSPRAAGTHPTPLAAPRSAPGHGTSAPISPPSAADAGAEHAAAAAAAAAAGATEMGGGGTGAAELSPAAGQVASQDEAAAAGAAAGAAEAAAGPAVGPGAAAGAARVRFAAPPSRLAWGGGAGPAPSADGAAGPAAAAQTEQQRAQFDQRPSPVGLAAILRTPPPQRQLAPLRLYPRQPERLLESKEGAAAPEPAAEAAAREAATGEGAEMEPLVLDSGTAAALAGSMDAAGAAGAAGDDRSGHGRGAEQAASGQQQRSGRLASADIDMARLELPFTAQPATEPQLPGPVSFPPAPAAGHPPQQPGMGAAAPDLKIPRLDSLPPIHTAPPRRHLPPPPPASAAATAGAAAAIAPGGEPAARARSASPPAYSPAALQHAPTAPSWASLESDPLPLMPSSPPFIAPISEGDVLELGPGLGAAVGPAAGIAGTAGAAPLGQLSFWSAGGPGPPSLPARALAGPPDLARQSAPVGAAQQRALSPTPLEAARFGQRPAPWLGAHPKGGWVWSVELTWWEAWWCGGGNPIHPALAPPMFPVGLLRCGMQTQMNACMRTKIESPNEARTNGRPGCPQCAPPIGPGARWRAPATSPGSPRLRCSSAA